MPSLSLHCIRMQSNTSLSHCGLYAHLHPSHSSLPPTSSTLDPLWHRARSESLNSSSSPTRLLASRPLPVLMLPIACSRSDVPAVTVFFPMSRVRRSSSHASKPKFVSTNPHLPTRNSPSISLSSWAHSHSFQTVIQPSWQPQH